MWKFPLYEIDFEIDWDAIEKRFKWFRDMKGVRQDKVWHAEGDVMTHTKMVCEALINLSEFKELSEQDKHIMFSSALMHDIEKRSTTTEKNLNGRKCVVAPSHAKKGEYTSRKILYKDIETPFEIREQICNIVRYHGIPLWSINDKDSEQRVIKTSLFVKNKFLSMIAKADILGRICNDAEEHLERIEFFEMLCKELECWDSPKKFPSNLSRHKFLNEGGWVEFEPFDDKKFDVYVMSALPGSGKDTYIKKEFNMPTLSLDDIRREWSVDPTDKKLNGKVIQEGKERAKQFMRERTSFVYNATNITRDMRNKWISLFMEYGAKVHVIYIEVPYKQLKSQNKEREHSVPEEVIDKLIGKLEIPNYTEAHNIQFIIDNP